jgi:hypothetical protein
MSHDPARGRQVVPGRAIVQLAVQQVPVPPFAAPSSHCSHASMMPLPHTAPPVGTAVQLLVQHAPSVPFVAPRSHSSQGSTTPSPHANGW